MQATDRKIESLLRDLPDEKAARLFLDRLAQEQPKAHRLLLKEPGLLSDTLALAAWSPLLATTLEQNPDYFSWLSRERTNARVRTRDELRESLARFALTHSSLPAQVVLARFRRRELLRVYLHDIRGTHTLVETTEELSNVADAVLEYALNLARQDLDNAFGLPRRHDERGRVATADFTIIALGKLGSAELNYASDIDLLFIYSDEGTTSGPGERGEVTNREYFVKLAETLIKLVGQPTGEGAAYRVDLRLRPHGRDGALACSLDEALRYYREKAQAWELQALIRSRASAGSASLFVRFAEALRGRVFRPDISVKDALASVRLAKQKIDRHRERNKGGFNVKLNRGGIRDIEFIAQALQLAYAGRDEWLRAPHTLISLGRLADRNLIHEQERTELSEAYVFLRTLEHRLQMEQGLQTHEVPQQPAQRTLVARRMNFSGADALESFDRALVLQTTNVRRVFDRVFKEEAAADANTSETENQSASPNQFDQNRSSTASLAMAAQSFLPHISSEADEPITVEKIVRDLNAAIIESLNPYRAITLVTRIAASLEKTATPIEITTANLRSMVQLCGASEFFGEILASNPALMSSLSRDPGVRIRHDFRSSLRSAIDSENTFAGEMSALRRQWFGLLLEIGSRDTAAVINVVESNRLQTELAVASLNTALLTARHELVRRYGRLLSTPRIAVLGLGRLGTSGVDYGSDLDIIIVYDSLVDSPVSSLTNDEFYAHLAELMIAALSSITREGYLYRVDLRLRPNGQSGPLVISAEGFLDYVREASVIWEWLAYVKLRAVAGDMDFGKMIETHARLAIHENARKASAEELQLETRRVRDRLQLERGRGARVGEIDIKYAAGGMLDVYFLSRYLQLRDDVADEGDDRSTRSTLDRLEARGSLESEDCLVLANGYALLRSVDHQLRLMVGKSARLPGVDHAVTRDIARKLGFASPDELQQTLIENMIDVRKTYDRITSEDQASE